MVDMVVHRHELRATLANLCRLLTKAPAAARAAQACRRAPRHAGAGRRVTASAARRLRACRDRAMTAVDSILARLLALHPKRIDLSLDRMWRMLDALGHPGAAAAAGDPCRRHQRQGLDHRLHARDAGGGGQARARLHLAASGALQRALPARRARRRRAGRPTRSSPTRSPNASAPMAARRSPCSRSDRGGLRAVRAPSRRRAAARSRARRPARRHQCGRAPARQRHHAGVDRSCRISRRHASSKIAAEKAGILKRGVPAIVAAQPREALAVIERAGARASRAPLHDRRRGLDRDRGARPAGLSGRRRPARSAGAEAVRPPSVRQCRRRDRGAARGRRAQAAAPPRSRAASRKADWPARMQRLVARHACRARCPPGSELWLDGGHNADGGRAIASALADLEERVSRPLVLVVGMLATKDCDGLPAQFRRARAPRRSRCRSRIRRRRCRPTTIAEAARAVGIPAQSARRHRGGARRDRARSSSIRRRAS